MCWGRSREPVRLEWAVTNVEILSALGDMKCWVAAERACAVPDVVRHERGCRLAAGKVPAGPVSVTVMVAGPHGGARPGAGTAPVVLATQSRGVCPKKLPELAQLGRSLWKRRRAILSYFDVGASNGPVEAINGRLERLRGIALGFRNLKHHILRSLIHSGQLQNRINAL